MSGLPKVSSKLVTILRRLRNEKNDGTRMQLLDLGRQALLNWFSMGARNLINGSVPMTKPTEKFVRRNLNYLTTLSDRHADLEVRHIAKRRCRVFRRRHHSESIEMAWKGT